MVSKSNVIQVSSVCICGNGDESNPQSNNFENKCAYCGQEGTLQTETQSNVEVNDENSNNYTSVKIICKNCGSEFCGQDGYDLLGGTRGTLTTVSPYDITSDDDEVSTTDENETTYMSGWEGLCDLLKPLDGEAMMVQRGDYVIIKKIGMPQSAKLWAYEGINVVDDSVTVTDYTPEIYNTFVVKWGESFEYELEFTFDKHRQLFGERRIVVEAKKISVVDEEESSDKNEDSGSIFDVILGSSDKNKELENVDTSSLNIDGDVSTEGSEAAQTEEVPIVDRDEAIQFGLTQVGKAKREDGHTVELKVIGNSLFQMGEWCHVRLPSFNEDSYMFISKCNLESSADSEYINSLTLVDYPPSLGKPKNKTNENEENEDEDKNDTDSTSGNSTDTSTDTSNASSTNDGTTTNN